MPALDELQGEAVKWQRRLAQLTSAGLSPAPALQLARTDLSRIASGGTPYPEDQYISMIHSAYTGQVTTPPSHGTDWNPLDVAGNVFKDISMDVRSFLPGLVHEGADIINPNKWAGLERGLTSFKGGSISDMAKEIQTLPILGPLVPGMFALSAGSSGITEHPLNFALDVFSLAAPATKLASLPLEAGAEGSTIAMLKEGHPLGAMAQATGIRAAVDRTIANLPGPLSEFASMPVWRKLEELTRIYTRKYGNGVISELQKAGIISKNMSQDEAFDLANQAIHYNSRYEKQPVPIDEGTIQAAGGDVSNLTYHVPPGEDVLAYTLGSPKAVDSAAIYFTRDDAMKAAQQLGGGAVKPEDLIQEVRVSKSDIAPDGTGGYKGTNLVPNRDVKGKAIYYDTKRAQQLKDIRQYVNKYRDIKAIDKLAKDKQKHDLVVLPDRNGKSTVYRRDSLPVKLHEAMHNHANRVEQIIKRRDVAGKAYKEANQAAQNLFQKYERFGESAADAARRPAGAPSLQALAFNVDSFLQHGTGTPYASLFSKLDQAFQSGSVNKVQTAVNNLRRALKGQPSYTREASYAKYISDQLKVIRSRSKAADALVKKRARAFHTMSKLNDEFKVATAKHTASQQEFYDALAENAPDNAYPLIEEQVRGGIKQMALNELRQKIQGGGIATAIQQARDKYASLVQKIDAAHTKEELQSVVDAKTFATVEKDAFNDWAQMQRAGYDPIWLSQVDADAYERLSWHSIRPLPDRPFTTESEKKRVFDYTGPGVLDIRVQLTNMAVEYLRKEATNNFLDWMINTSGVVRKKSDILTDLNKRYGKVPGLVEEHFREEYRTFDAKKFLGHNNDLQLGDEYVIPRNTAEGFDRLMSGNRLPFAKVTDPLHRVWKLTVLSGPRHFAHVAVGGLLMEALRTPESIFDLLAHPVALAKAARTGVWPDEIVNQIGAARLAEIGDEWRKGNYEERPEDFMDVTDRVWQYHSGGWAGRMIGQYWRKSAAREGIVNVTEKLNNFENTITDMYRGSVLLHEMRHNATNEQAMTLINKVFIDVDNMTPWERSTLRQIFPFWTFTKHILRYVLTYPSDHPLRASILAHLAKNIEEDQSSGDPARLSKLMMLGEPDATGKITTVDLSNANPFRSMSSIFSAAGFFQGLAPELQLGLKKAFGFDPITGMPTFRPHLTYDAYSGTNKAESEPLSIFDFVGAFIPQADIIDHYMLFTDTMRQLKKTNPEAYTRSLWQAANLPFIVAPVNIYDVRAKSAAAQYVVASQAVADAMRTGNTDGILKFVAVPFEGQLYPADQVANYLDNFHQLYPQFAPKAIMKPPKRRKRTQL